MEYHGEWFAEWAPQLCGKPVDGHLDHLLESCLTATQASVTLSVSGAVSFSRMPIHHSR